MILLAASALVAEAARAELVTVEPDDFARGSVLTDVFPGLTLTATGRSTQSPDLRVALPGLGRASTGELTFGYFDGFTWRDDIVTQAFFNADFDEPTSFVAIDVVRTGSAGATAAPGVMWAYDAAGNLLETARTLGGQSDFETLLITRDVADIARVEVTGAFDPVVLDHFRYEAEGDLPPPSCETRLQSCEAELTRTIEECEGSSDGEELAACRADVESLLVENEELVGVANEALRENEQLRSELERAKRRNRQLRRTLRRLLAFLGWRD